MGMIKKGMKIENLMKYQREKEFREYMDDELDNNNKRMQKRKQIMSVINNLANEGSSNQITEKQVDNSKEDKKSNLNPVKKLININIGLQRMQRASIRANFIQTEPSFNDLVSNFTQQDNLNANRISSPTNKFSKFHEAQGQIIKNEYLNQPKREFNSYKYSVSQQLEDNSIKSCQILQKSDSSATQSSDIYQSSLYTALRQQSSLHQQPKLSLLDPFSVSPIHLPISNINSENKFFQINQYLQPNQTQSNQTHSTQYDQLSEQGQFQKQIQLNPQLQFNEYFQKNRNVRLNEQVELNEATKQKIYNQKNEQNVKNKQVRKTYQKRQQLNKNISLMGMGNDNSLRQRRQTSQGNYFASKRMSEVDQSVDSVLQDIAKQAITNQQISAQQLIVTIDDYEHSKIHSFNPYQNNNNNNNNNTTQELKKISQLLSHNKQYNLKKIQLIREQSSLIKSNYQDSTINNTPSNAQYNKNNNQCKFNFSVNLRNEQQQSPLSCLNSQHRKLSSSWFKDQISMRDSLTPRTNQIQLSSKMSNSTNRSQNTSKEINIHKLGLQKDKSKQFSSTPISMGIRQRNSIFTNQ